MNLVRSLCRHTIAFVLLLSPFVTHAATTPPDVSVAYQIDQRHAGQQTSYYFTLPLTKKWAINLGYDISYPIIADGKVFVIAGDNTGSDLLLYALDLSTGQQLRTPLSVKGTYWFANACYDNGTIFVINYDGLMGAYDATTGAHQWTIQCPGQYAFSSPPTAQNGIVYVGGAGSGGTLYAVRESDGALLWTASVENGDNSSPAVTSQGVYVSYAGPQVYDFDPIAGSQIWHYNSGIEGGGGKTPAYYNGYLYARDTGSGYIFNASTGALVNSFSYGPAPAFYKNTGFFLHSGSLTAINLTNGVPIWQYSPSGDPFVSAPVVINNIVYAGTGSGVVYGLRTKTGAVAFHDSTGMSILAPDEQNVSQPLTGFGAGQEALVVPAGHYLVAYGPSRKAKDVTSTLTIQASSFTYNSTTHLYDQTVTLTNNSASAIAHPITYILDQLTSGVLVTNAAGQTIWTAPAHSPYLTVLSASTLGIGNSITFAVHCSAASSAISYTPRILAGWGAR